MTLKDALESGKRFRRSSWSVVNDFSLTQNKTLFPVQEILATDWEVEEERISLSAAEVSHVLSNVFAVHIPDRTKHEVLLKLGFK